MNQTNEDTQVVKNNSHYKIPWIKAGKVVGLYFLAGFVITAFSSIKFEGRYAIQTGWGILMLGVFFFVAVSYRHLKRYNEMAAEIEKGYKLLEERNVFSLYLQQKLKTDNDYLRTIIHEAPVMIVAFDMDNKIVEFNPRSQLVTGYTREEAIGKDVVELISTQGNEENSRKIISKIKNNFKVKNNEAPIKKKNGEVAEVLWNNEIYHDEYGNAAGIIAIGLDTTDRKEMEKRLHKLAYYDHLTGMSNITLFKEKVELVAKEIENTEKKAVLIILDIDDIKHINDTLGHQAGDELIRHIGKIIKSYISQTGLYARISGDSFVCLVLYNEKEELLSLTENVFMNVRKPWIYMGQEYFVTVSMGGADYDTDGKDYATLLRKADIALTWCKESGKNRYVSYEKMMGDKTLRFMELGREIRKAIKSEEFELYYQPKIDVKSCGIIGAEALIRWKHPSKGFVSPVEFIPFAEETGYIKSIERWVFETACKQKKHLKKVGYENIQMSVNMSGISLAEPDTVNFLQYLVNKYELQTWDVVIEITETAVIKDLGHAIDTLNKLKSLGFMIALDDFGTGYSSLTHLLKLPIDIVKVDRTFIMQICEDKETEIIFESVVKLCHKLGLIVVAEGVETKDQFELIKNYNCDIAQGYLFGRPMPSGEFMSIMEELVSLSEKNDKYFSWRVK
ncbi:sensor domain-containing protein [Alkalibacter saccharofermentans]|uniref:PAS domain S-box-containing protein/diguanylate cyclase (GGDEF) domain-containing protein n=1 Tax=Alkalibacter saccharofermentans DSM 14828 TaxID=1120975 RepID=A0A1M4VKE1_9FIRM|nr:GGDEF domain-containing phosphodiesterase [Alkalibacter saccharofermentans]SHE69469.1 PAS domain S-box-containing protein/diguanylate cyclase (GGDEF) domain-containing protein [Alkalibacter saccharofermentans DSM 14828]